MKTFFKHWLVLAAGLAVAGTAFAQAEVKPNEIIVKYKEGVRRNRVVMNEIYASANVVKVKRFQGSRELEQLILKPGTDIDATLEQLEHSKYVEFAEPNHVIHALSAPIREAANARPSAGGLPCIPGMEVPGCDPHACLMPNFPPGCTDNGNSPTPSPTPPPGDNPNPSPQPDPQPQPPARPPIADKPADVNPPVADPQLAQAYGIAKIGAPDAWKVTRGSQDIVVAVIDTGVDYNHEDLSFNMWRNPHPDAKDKDIVGYDFIHNDGLPFDDHSHGSHCAGVIGAVGGNGKGISGVNQRVSIMAVKFLSADGSGDEAGAIRAIDYAASHGARVLSNSWGGSGGGDDQIKGLKDAVLRAESKGVIFVAAAGNESSDNDSTPEFPAGFNTPNMISVAATDDKDELAYFSNTGAKSVHLAAPGVDIYSSTPGNKYEKMSGTSMACPHVAGAAALVWSTDPSMTAAQVKQKLIDSVDKIPGLAGKTVSGGRLNVARAVGAVH